MKIMRSLIKFFQIMDEKIKQEPSENDCLLIIDKINLIINSLSRYEQAEAYAILDWLELISPK